MLVRCIWFEIIDQARRASQKFYHLCASIFAKPTIMRELGPMHPVVQSTTTSKKAAKSQHHTFIIYMLQTQIFLQRIMIGRWCSFDTSHHLLSLRSRVYNSPTRIHVRLLGPCFKTGQIMLFRQHHDITEPKPNLYAFSSIKPHGKFKLATTQETQAFQADS